MSSPSNSIIALDPDLPRTKPWVRLRGNSWYWLCGSALLLLVTAAGMTFWLWRSPPSAEAIKAALARRQFDEVIDLAQRRLQRYPDEHSTRLALGEAYQRQQRSAEALAAFRLIPETAGADALAARLASASLLIHEGRLLDAEQAVQSAYSIDPENRYVDELHLEILNLTGQRWYSLPVLHRILARPKPRFSHLICLANPDEMPAPPDDIFARMFSVGDALGLLGAAHAAAALGRKEQAHELVRRVLEHRSELVEAYVLEATLLVDEGQLDQFDQWCENMPPAVQAHPGYWYNLGRRVHHHGDVRSAIRCYWEALRRQPNHDRATYQMGQVLAADGQKDLAQRFLDRGKKLNELVILAVELFDGLDNDERFWDCAQLTRDLGRLPESAAWCELLLERNPRHQSARRLLDSLMKSWDHRPPPLLPQHDLAADFPGESFPLPTLTTPDSLPAGLPVADHSARIRFDDVAEDSGLNFTYSCGDDPNKPGKKMYEYTGGGAAVLDYDRDGWPDVFFSQGSSKPGDLAQRAYCDALFRNREGSSFLEVTHNARVADYGFGQGATVGDFDNDGFPDLYIANIDGNRLFQNQGDGTFRDITAAAGLGHPFWTTSCLLADINDDGIVDVYDVTFLQGDDVFEKMCRGKDDPLRSCAPKGFPAAPDQVYLGRGDGTFARLGPQAGFDVPDGDGLGIVAADLDHSGRLSLFIANDGRANFLFLPEASTGPVQHWNEAGVLSGVAYDEGGSPRAFMGIAASDANNDGLVDLFVTTFYLESNVFFLNLGDLAFSDRARSTGLREPSMEQLGFGTQFLDADNDGWEDLLVLNGHVDDFSHRQIPYKMPAQLYANANGRFREVTADSLGPFFSDLRLGRGLATLDWNRDGLMDAVASHIGDAAALVTNRTREPGASVSLQLVGSNRSRDAIGARVVVKAGDVVREKQLTAGDGYHASNERRLIIGLGEVERAVGAAQVEIHWPGGQTQHFDDVEFNREYLAIEGRERLTMLLR